MHLLNLSNFDYVMMTTLFGVILAISYFFRRKNPSHAAFLMLESHKVPTVVKFFSLGSLGLIEFVVLSSYGAFAGIPALCIIVPIYLLGSMFFEGRVQNSPVMQTINDGKSGGLNTKFISGAYALYLLFVAGAAIMIMVSLLKTMLGWEFGNSTLSLLGLITCSLLIGGMVSAVYNQFIALLITLILFLVVLFLGYQNIGNGHLLSNLHEVALNNKLTINTFTSPKFSYSALSQIWLLIIGSFLIITINPQVFLKQKSSIPSSRNFLPIIRLGRLFLIALIMFLGILALATPNSQPALNGQKIITQETRLSDGSLGYVVKAIPNDQPTLQRGIIPQNMDDNNQITSINSSGATFDYINAAMVVIKKVVPVAFISLFIVVLLFYKSISESVTFATTIIIRAFYVPLYNKSGEELENLWATRVFLFALLMVSMAIGLVFFKFFDIYYVCGVLFLLGLPIILNLIGLTSFWLLDILCYVMIIVILLAAKIIGVPSAMPIITFNSFIQMLSFVTLGVVAFYIFSFCFIKIVRKIN